VAEDDLGRRVARKERFSVEVDLGKDGLFLVGFESDPDTITLYSGAVTRILPDGRKMMDLTRFEAGPALEVAQQGMSVLTSQEVLID
jgi:hypothetical protein